MLVELNIWIIGKAKGLEAITCEDYIRAYTETDRTIRPRRIVLTVRDKRLCSGDVDAAVFKCIIL